jgi:hypothetical protein
MPYILTFITKDNTNYILGTCQDEKGINEIIENYNNISYNITILDVKKRYICLEHYDYLDELYYKYYFNFPYIIREELSKFWFIPWEGSSNNIFITGDETDNIYNIIENSTLLP